MPYTAWLLCIFGAGVAIAAPTVPSFRCSDADGVNYDVWIGTGQNRLVINEKKKSREILLSGSTSDADVDNAPLSYVGWNPKGTDVATQYSFEHEFQVHYRVSDKGSEAVVALTVDDRNRAGLKCVTAGIAVNTIPADSVKAPLVRDAELFNRSARMRNYEGDLLPMGLLGVNAALRRFVALPDHSRPAQRQAFVKETRDAVRNLSQNSVIEIATKVPVEVARYWKDLLSASQYRYVSQSQRFADWVKEGASSSQADVYSIVAGINAFAKSKEFAQKDIREFFNKEVSALLRKLPANEASEIFARLDKTAQPFYSELMGSGPTALPAPAQAEIQRAADEMIALLKATEYEPRKVASAITAFLATPLGRDRRAQKSLLAIAGPEFRKLNARQREDLLGWCDDFNAQLLVQKLVR